MIPVLWPVHRSLRCGGAERRPCVDKIDALRQRYAPDHFTDVLALLVDRRGREHTPIGLHYLADLGRIGDRQIDLVRDHLVGRVAIHARRRGDVDHRHRHVPKPLAQPHQRPLIHNHRRLGLLLVERQRRNIELPGAMRPVADDDLLRGWLVRKFPLEIAIPHQEARHPE
jgi:hypothetical protein